MPDYRYYGSDILTGNVLAELPLYGVWMSRVLSSTGEFTAAYKLGSGLHDDASIIDGTAPGKAAVYVERDGALIWGGIIWSRTYAEESQTMSLTGQTFESIFDHVPLLNDFVHQTEDQLQIFKAMVDAIQAQPHNNFGIDTSLVGTSGIPRTVLVPGYEFHYAQEVVDQLVDTDYGFDYTIEVAPSNITDQPQKILRVGYPQLGTNVKESAITYDYPGNIEKFWWPENGTSSGTTFVGMGAGAGVAMPKSVQVASELIGAGYPAWYIVNSYKDVTDQNILNGKTAADRTRLKMPLSAPTFDLKSDGDPGFDAWNRLGADFSVHIESYRFPNGKDVVSRMIGWELQVADSDNDELIKLTIEGGDDSGG